MNDLNKSNSFSKHIVNAFWRALYVFNIFLFSLFFVQAIFLTALYFSRSFKLPQSVCDFVNYKLEEVGIQSKETSICVDVHGKIIIENLSLRFIGTANDFFKAKEIKVKLPLFSLLNRQIAIDAIQVEKADFDNIEKSKNSGVLKNVSFSLRRKGIWWTLEKMKGSFGNVGISASGTFSEKIFSKDFSSNDKDEDKSEEKSLAKKWGEVFQNILKTKEYVDRFKHSTLILSFEASSDSIDNLSLSYRTREAVFLLDNNKDAIFNNLRISANLTKGDLTKKTAKVSVYAQNFTYDKNIKCCNIDFFALADFENMALYNLELSSSDISLYGVNIYYINAFADTLSEKNQPKELELYIHRLEKFYTKIMAYRQGSQINAEFESFEDILFIKDFSFFPKIKELNDFSFKDGAFLTGSAFFDRDNLDVKVDAKFECGKSVFYKIALSEAFAKLRYDSKSGEFNAENISLTSSENWTIGGSVYQNLKNYDYEFLINGHLRPAAINHIMEHWWTKIVGEFKFQDNFPSADVYVKSRWGDPNFIWCFAKVGGGKVLYNGHIFDSVSLKINVDPSVISIYDVDVQDADNGYCNAALCWTYNPKIGIDRYYERIVLGDASMLKSGLFALGGEDVDELKPILNFEKKASVKLTLKCANPYRQKDAKEEIAFLFDSPSFIDIGGFPFESISASGTVNGNIYDMKNIKASFCGGDLIGDFLVEKKDNKNFFKAVFDIKKMDQQKAEDFIVKISGADKKIDEDKDEGIVNLKGTAVGVLDDFKSVNANANIVIDNADLAKLNILGGISRLLDSLRFPIATFKYDKFTSNMTLENGVLYFSDLIVEGHSSNIRGKAKYNCFSDALSARLYFTWLGGSTLPIVSNLASLAFNPFIGAVQIKVSNTFADPKFSATLMPQNIFNSTDSMVENIDEDKL